MSARSISFTIVLVVLVLAANANSRVPDDGGMRWKQFSAAEAECLAKAYRLLESDLRLKQNDGGSPPEVIYLLQTPPTPCEVEVATAGSGKGGGTVVRFLSDGGYEIQGTK